MQDFIWKLDHKVCKHLTREKEEDWVLLHEEHDKMIGKLVKDEDKVFDKYIDFSGLLNACIRCGTDNTCVYIVVGDPLIFHSTEHLHTNDQYLFNYIVNRKYGNYRKHVFASDNASEWKEIGEDYKPEADKLEREWVKTIIEWAENNFQDKEFVQELKEEFNTLRQEVPFL